MAKHKETGLNKTQVETLKRAMNTLKENDSEVWFQAQQAGPRNQTFVFLTCFEPYCTTGDDIDAAAKILASSDFELKQIFNGQWYFCGRGFPTH